MSVAHQISGTVRLPIMQAEKFSALKPPSRGPARNVACPYIGRHDHLHVNTGRSRRSSPRPSSHGCNRNIFSQMWAFSSELLPALISESVTNALLSITCFFSASLFTRSRDLLILLSAGLVPSFTIWSGYWIFSTLLATDSYQIGPLSILPTIRVLVV